MRAEPTAEDMRDAMVQVAEEATYMFMYEPPAYAVWPEEMLMAHIEVHDPYSGELVLVASPAFCARMAASLEGHDEPGVESNAKRSDALREMLNMICGILVGESGQTTAEPGFGIPYVKLGGREVLDNLLSVASRCVVLEAASGDRMALLFVHEEAPAS